MRQSILFLALWLSAAYATADVTCGIVNVAKCNDCPANIGVACEGKGQGYVEGKGKPSSLVVQIYDRTSGKMDTKTLAAPERSIQTYTANLENDPWVLRQLGDQGITVRSSTMLTLVGAKFPDSLSVYSDPDKRTKIAAVGAGVTPYAYDCYYSAKVNLVQSKGNRCKSTCSARANCFKKDGSPIGDADLLCTAIDSSTCPSASACASDEDTTAKQATFKTDEGEGALRTRTISVKAEQ